MKPTKALRKKLDNWKEKPIVAPGVHDPYCARIAERLGFDTLYMGGAATSMSRLGMADFGLATGTEVQANARYITSVTDLPLIADSDNAYGNALNTMRTVKDYVRAGVAGVHIEDQVVPKRCGHLKGKMVVSLDEMVGKIKAAKKVINEEDPDFVLIARTDARGAVGGGLDDAVDRLKAYRRAGADLVFADGLTSKEELATICTETGAPAVFHPTAISPRLSVAECHAMGVALMLYPFASIHAMAVAVWEFLADLKKDDTKAQVRFERQHEDHPLSDLRRLFDLGGLAQLKAYEREFIPAEEVKAKYGRQTVGI
jgi:2-methylisocitrate lyase-like PEP mutase family enzyme